ncbi:unnamed protein product [Oikopleura dioica]|uniref:Peptide-O-fucosyltransferase n=1 Tax=Oikopleura dioica TaxID=34765 RepID=E4YW76_OIKDI|nr:unnamed protein product [Oikopleura dioica]
MGRRPYSREALCNENADSINFLSTLKSAFYQLKVGLTGSNNGRLFRTCREIDCIVDDLDCEKTPSHCLENIALPVVPEKKPKGRFGQDGNFTFLETTYNTNNSCALMAFPYMDINFARNIFNSKFSPQDRELMADIIKATARPRNMEKVAQEFIDKFMKSGFVALHWRYNDDDWWHGGCDIDSGVFMNGGDLEDKGPKLCKKLSLMRKPEIFAQQVNIYLSRKINAPEKDGRFIPQNIKIMYIATPPSETSLIIKMRKELKLINPKITIFMQSELEPFVRNFYKSQNCGELGTEFWEILSLVELETCLRASIFLGSQGSSWSRNTNIERRLNGYNLLDAGNEIIMPDLSDYKF